MDWAKSPGLSFSVWNGSIFIDTDIHRYRHVSIYAAVFSSSIFKYIRKKTGTGYFRLFSGRENGSLFSSFVKTIISNRSLLFQQTCSSLLKSNSNRKRTSDSDAVLQQRTGYLPSVPSADRSRLDSASVRRAHAWKMRNRSCSTTISWIQTGTTSSLGIGNYDLIRKCTPLIFEGDQRP